MIPSVRYCKARLTLINSNLTLVRHLYVKKNHPDPKYVANQILEDNHEQFHKTSEKISTDAHEIAESIITDFPELPVEPTTCCMSGCANCVWLDYAEKLSHYYKDGGEHAIKQINENVTDANIKAFLLHELRMRKKTS